MIARAVTVIGGATFQVAGLYAGIVAFGFWNTLGIYCMGALASILQHRILTRRNSC